MNADGQSDQAAAHSAPLVDAEARALIRTALDRTMVVEAAAGTGKTTELVNRIIAVLANGQATVDSLAAVTFTEKAAGELKLRLRAGLEEARQAAAPSTPRRGHLERALIHLEEAHVSTIHGFCADLLRERPVEAGVDPRFRTMTEPEAERLYAEAFNRWLQEQLEHPPEGVRRSLRRSTDARYDDGPAGRLRRAGWLLAAWRDFPAEWRRDPFDREAEIDALVNALQRFAERTAPGARRHDLFDRDTEPACRLVEQQRMMESVRPRDDDWLESALIALARDQSFSRPRGASRSGRGRDLSLDERRSAHAELLAALRAFAVAADADLAARLRQELREPIDRYERLKERAGRLDFVDLLVRARNLIRDSASVRADFQRRFTHLFVDEFQDTDPLQAEILLLLASDDPAVDQWRDVSPAPGKLFIVGDPKQSIYRFRRADVGIYQEVKDLVAACGALCVNLTTSFRSRPMIQHAVNAAFTPLMTGDSQALQAGYVPLAPWRTDEPEQPALIVLPVPQPYGLARISAKAIEPSLADATGALVEWLTTQSGWTVTEREHPRDRVPIAARHICLLFRRFESWGEDVTRGYVQALEARGIPHLLVGGKSFHVREEVETMRAALSAIEWPDDELSIFATLRGPLFAIGDAALLEYRLGCGDADPRSPGRPRRRLHPLDLPRAPLPEHLAPIGEALALLQSLHRHRNERPVSETISLLLEATRAPASFVLRPSGEQVLANVLHLAELARTYERTGGLSFRGFVEQLRDEALGGQAPEAPILEEGSDGVRVMTVHRAKGLEFPVVILADLTARLSRSDASRYIDGSRGLCALRLGGWSPRELLEHTEEEAARDQAEGVRIAYVAATRARDLLVVPALGDEPFAAGWVSPLNGAIYPELSRRRHPSPALGCPAFGPDTVLTRPAEVFPADTVRPGLYDIAPHGYGVVWWDPSTLSLNATPRFGLRQEALLGKAVDPGVLAADLATFRNWAAERAATVAGAARPSRTVYTATEYAAHAVTVPPPVTIVTLERPFERPSGARYGTLVHAVLATVPFDAAPPDVGAATRWHGRVVGATPEEVTFAAAAVTTALRHPLLVRARAAALRGECRQEIPLTLRDVDGTFVDGIVDLAFRDDGRWTVIDFKTDRVLERADAYRRQVSLYAAAISTATGIPATAVLMLV